VLLQLVRTPNTALYSTNVICVLVHRTKNLYTAGNVEDEYNDCEYDKPVYLYTLRGWTIGELKRN